MAETNLHAGVAITLVVSASNDYISFARLTATQLAAKIGFDFDAIEDVRIAVSELCGTLIACAAPEADLQLEYAADNASLTVSGHAAIAPGATLTPDELSDQVLAAVTDSYGYETVDGFASFRMTRASRPGAA